MTRRENTFDALLEELQQAAKLTPQQWGRARAVLRSHAGEFVRLPSLHRWDRDDAKRIAARTAAHGMTRSEMVARFTAGGMPDRTAQRLVDNARASLRRPAGKGKP